MWSFAVSISRCVAKMSINAAALLIDQILSSSCPRDQALFATTTTKAIFETKISVKYCHRVRRQFGRYPMPVKMYRENSNPFLATFKVWRFLLSRFTRARPMYRKSRSREEKTFERNLSAEIVYSCGSTEVECSKRGEGRRGERGRREGGLTPFRKIILPRVIVLLQARKGARVGYAKN